MAKPTSLSKEQKSLIRSFCGLCGDIKSFRTQDDVIRPLSQDTPSLYGNLPPILRGHPIHQYHQHIDLIEKSKLALQEYQGLDPELQICAAQALGANFEHVAKSGMSAEKAISTLLGMLEKIVSPNGIKLLRYEIDHAQKQPNHSAAGYRSFRRPEENHKGHVVRRHKAHDINRGKQ